METCLPLPSLQGISDLKHSKSSAQLHDSLDRRLSCRIMEFQPFFLSFFGGDLGCHWILQDQAWESLNG